jgi:hypothetical protein
MYVQGSTKHQPSLGVDDLTCGEGEEWDWNAMTCVTAGQAITPTPQPPPAPLPPFVTTPPIMAPPPVEPTFYEKYKTPILVAGAVAAALVVGYLVTPSTATSNARRPPKPWMCKCVKGVAKGKAKDPGAVCGAQWYRKMSPSQRRAAKRKAYGR